VGYTLYLSGLLHLLFSCKMVGYYKLAQIAVKQVHIEVYLKIQDITGVKGVILLENTGHPAYN